MKDSLKKIIFGFLIWLLPFLASFLLNPIREHNRILFESIMPLILTILVLTFTITYFKKITQAYLYNGILLGGLWFIISIIIDLIMFMPKSQWHMTFIDYVMDIGLTYLIILIIPIEIGYLLQNIKQKHLENNT